jgi:hypothetical protein
MMTSKTTVDSAIRSFDHSKPPPWKIKRVQERFLLASARFRERQAAWELQLGAAVRSSPASFLIGGTQQIAVTAGSSLFVFGN